MTVLAIIVVGFIIGYWLVSIYEELQFIGKMLEDLKIEIRSRR